MTAGLTSSRLPALALVPRKKSSDAAVLKRKIDRSAETSRRSPPRVTALGQVYRVEQKTTSRHTHRDSGTRQDTHLKKLDNFLPVEPNDRRAFQWWPPKVETDRVVLMQHRPILLHLPYWFISADLSYVESVLRIFRGPIPWALPHRKRITPLWDWEQRRETTASNNRDLLPIRRCHGTAGAYMPCHLPRGQTRNSRITVSSIRFSLSSRIMSLQCNRMYEDFHCPWSYFT